MGMGMRVFALVALGLSLGACANNNFSGSGSGSGGTSEPSVNTSGTVDTSGLPAGSGSGGTTVLYDGLYYSLQYKTACSDGGPIDIILISNSGSQAALTRQSCVNLGAPIALNLSGVVGSNATTISYAGTIFILGQL